MKHLYSTNTAAFTLQPIAKALGTALSSKIILFLLVGFFLLVSGKGMAQETTLYSNGFSSSDGLVVQNVTRGKIGVLNGVLDASTINGNNNGYAGYIAINSRQFNLVAGYTYIVTFQARANNQNGAADGTVQVRYGNNVTNAGSSQGILVGGTTIAKSAQFATYSITFSVPNSLLNQILALQLFSEETNNTHLYIDNLSIIQSCAPSAPQVLSASTCSSPASLTLTASGASSNETYRWYRQGETGLILIENEIGSTYKTDILTASATYYVSKHNGACESPKVRVDAIIGGAIAPAVNSTENCPEKEVILIASGAEIGDTYKWYNSSGADITTEAEFDNTNNTSRLTRKRANQYGTYYATIVKSSAAGGCESSRTAVNILQQGQDIQAPNVTSASRCGIGPVTLTASGALEGEDYLWYTNESGGTAIHRGAIYTANSLPVGSTTFYVSKINNALGCESATRTPATATVNSPTAVTGSVSPDGPVDANGSATFTVTSNIISDKNAVGYFWEIKKVGGEFEPYGYSTTNSYRIDNIPANLSAVRVGIWIGSSGCYGSTTEPYEAGSIYYIESETITPLPVELVSFKAQRHAQGVSLTWVTASEQDNSGFEVQVSLDGRNFQKLAFVESKVGTTSLKQNYSFLDTKAVSGTRYYRLKQIDFDGKSEYSAIRAVSLDGDNGVAAAYPNPFDDVVTVRLTGTESRQVKAVLMDAMGKVILETTEETAGNSISVNMSRVTTKGLYMLHVLDNGTKHTFKLMKR
jgi:hypothetical protein